MYPKHIFCFGIYTLISYLVWETLDIFFNKLYNIEVDNSSFSKQTANLVVHILK